MNQSREQNYQGVFDTSIGFGDNPAILVIDLIKAYTTEGAPFFGRGVVDAVDHSVPLLDAARAAKVPIIYTKVLYHPSGMDGGLFIKKVPALRMLVEGEPLAEIDPKITPHPEDLVIVKNRLGPVGGAHMGTARHELRRCPVERVEIHTELVHRPGQQPVALAFLGWSDKCIVLNVEG